LGQRLLVAFCKIHQPIVAIHQRFECFKINADSWRSIDKEKVIDEIIGWADS